MSHPLQTGVRATPEALVILLDILTNGTPEDDTGRDPTEAELDAWLLSMVEDGGAE